jgi:hypothetical protein
MADQPNKTLPEFTDRELLEMQCRQLESIKHSAKGTNSWMTFFGILTILSLAVSALMFIAAL